MPSPFLTPGHVSQADSLAVLHLRRNHLIPTLLRTHDDENLGYDEGKVTNTRFGSFPHSTLIGKPWGSQIIASEVDTGSRGRRGAKTPSGDVSALKRKAEDIETPDCGNEAKVTQKVATAASSGFLHLLTPTPESWTSSLPHRTQVVYTPDYSYILHRLRVRPGSTIIEAGAGSGSFTHASARAVFNGYPSDTHTAKKRKLGKVHSFEFHKQRVEKIREEIRDHGLEGIVEVTHRDVYNEGFLLGDPISGESPKANAVFLDLPAPWLALKHLRQPSEGVKSPFDPSSPVHICTFSPCLEQAQQTIRTLRQHSWLSISMVEVTHRNIEVRRERYGAEAEGARGSLPGPRNVEEAIARLQMIEDRWKAFHENQQQSEADSAYLASKEDDDEAGRNSDNPIIQQEKATLPGNNLNSKIASSSLASIPSFRQGKLIHRSEPELKTHTSYLVFAILPRVWSDEDEQRCRQKWPSCGKSNVANGVPGDGSKNKKQMKGAIWERARLKSEGTRDGKIGNGEE